jgi:hypothetical protein
MVVRWLLLRSVAACCCVQWAAAASKNDMLVCNGASALSRGLIAEVYQRYPHEFAFSDAREVRVAPCTLCA